MLVGVIIMLWALSMAVAARFYTLKLLRLYGINKVEDYPIFIRMVELDDNDCPLNERKLNAEEVKQAVEEVKSSLNRKELMKKRDNMNRSFSIGSIQSWISSSFRQSDTNIPVPPSPSSPESSASLTQPSSAPHLSDLRKSVNEERRDAILEIAKTINEDTEDGRKESKSGKIRWSLVRTASVIKVSKDRRIKEVAENMESHKYAIDLKQLFLFRAPHLFFEMIDLLLMAISLYLSFWVCDCVTIAQQLHTSNRSMWILLTFFPGLVSVLLFAAIVDQTVPIMSICTLDADIIEEIQEQQEVVTQLGAFVGGKILRRLQAMGEGRAYLEDLFRAIDTNGSNLLSCDEFKSFCTEMSISFSNKRWRQIFREIDSNCDNEVSFEELFLFLYPDSDEAREHKNMQKQINASAMQRIEEYMYAGSNNDNFEYSLQRLEVMSSKLRKGELDNRFITNKNRILSMQSTSITRYPGSDLSSMKMKVADASSFVPGLTSVSRDYDGL